MTPKIFHKI